MSEFVQQNTGACLCLALAVVLALCWGLDALGNWLFGKREQ